MPVGIFEPWDQYSGLLSTAGTGLQNTWDYYTIGGSTGISFITGFGGIGKALWMKESLFGENIRRPFPATKQVSMSFGFRRTSTLQGQTSHAWMNLLDEAYVKQFGFQTIITHQWQLTGEDGTVLATTTDAFLEEVDYYCTLKVDVTDPLNCSLVLIANGVEQMNVTGLDLVDSAASLFLAALEFRTVNTGNDVRFFGCVIDSVYLLYDEYVDLPETQFIALPGTADDTTAWTPLSGVDNFAMIDEAQADGDTTYNTSDVVGAIDMFTHAPLSYVPESIVAVGVISFARKENVGTRTMKNKIQIGATTASGADFNLSTIYTQDVDAWQLNPDDAAAWELADVNAVKSGYELVL